MVLWRGQHIKLGRLEVGPVGSRNAFAPLSLLPPAWRTLRSASTCSPASSSAAFPDIHNSGFRAARDGSPPHQVTE